MKYVPELDVLRAFSILFVLEAHVAYGGEALGGFGVLMFFFISGYLITSILNKEIAESNKLNFKNFYTKRILRLYPALLTFTGLNVFLIWLLGDVLHVNEFFAALFYYENYYLGFHNYPSNKSFGILWSLAVEEHFYILFPLLLFLFRKKIVPLIGALIGLVLLFKIIHFVAVQKSIFLLTNDIYYYTHYRIDAILFGCLFAFPQTHIKINKATKIAVLCFLPLTIIYDYYFNNLIATCLVTTLQSFSLFLLFPFINDLKKIPQNGKKFFIFCGKISYSLYLYHWIIFYLLLKANFSHYTGLKRYMLIVLFFILSFVVSYLSYRFIEQPFLKIKDKLARKKKNAVPVSTLPENNLQPEIALVTTQILVNPAN